MPDYSLQRTPQSLGDFLPNAVSEELVEIDVFLDRYLALALRIYEDILTDPERHAAFLALTGLEVPPTMTAKTGY